MDLIENVIEDEGIRDYNITEGRGSAKGDGYLGVISTFDVVGKNKENKTQDLNLLLKFATPSDALRKVFPVSNLFCREIYTYQIVIPVFNKFETEKGLSPLQIGPKFYKSCAEEKREALVLENLKSTGYRLYERKIPMDEDHVKLVLKHYGRFHALSLALREQNPTDFTDSFNFIDDVFEKAVFRTPFKDLLLNNCMKVKELLDSKHVKKYEEFLNSYQEYIDNLTKDYFESRVYLHGDCWTNNMMFKYEGNEKKSLPTEVRFIDFQLSRIGSPVIDLAYFFYACSSKKIMNSLEEYLRIYYDSLSSHMRKLGTDPENIFTFATLLEHWKKYAKFGLIMALSVIHIMLTEKEDAVDLSETADSGRSLTETFSNSNSIPADYNSRVNDIISHFLSNNFI